MPKQYLTKEQAAPLVGLTPNALYNRAYRREIPFVKVGRRIFFDPQKLLDWWAKHEQEPIK